MPFVIKNILTWPWWGNKISNPNIYFADIKTFFVTYILWCHFSDIQDECFQKYFEYQIMCISKVSNILFIIFFYILWKYSVCIKTFSGTIIHQFDQIRALMRSYLSFFCFFSLQHFVIDSKDWSFLTLRKTGHMYIHCIHKRALDVFF